jgi:hypothetical protein
MTFSSEGQTKSSADPSKSPFDPLPNGFGHEEIDFNPFGNESNSDFFGSKPKIIVLRRVKTTDFIKKVIPQPVR